MMSTWSRGRVTSYKVLKPGSGHNMTRDSLGPLCCPEETIVSVSVQRSGGQGVARKKATKMGGQYLYSVPPRAPLGGPLLRTCREPRGLE